MIRNRSWLLDSKLRTALRTAVGAAAVVALVQSEAAAQGFGRVAADPWSGVVTVHNRMTAPGKPISSVDRSGVREMPGSLAQPSTAKPAAAPPERVSVNLAPYIQAWWDQRRPQLIATAGSFLHERDIGGGFRTSRNRVTLARSGSMLVGTDGDGFTVRYLLNGNSLSTYLRTPSGLLGSRDTDPGFLVRFDLEVTLDFSVRNNALVAGPARIQPRVYPPEGRNITGALTTAVADLVKTLSGVDFVGRLLAAVNSTPIERDAGLNQALGTINPLLQKAASGGAIQTTYKATDGSVVFTLVNASSGPVVR